MYRVVVCGDGCRCHRCEEREFERESKAKIAAFFTSIGFTPRNYSEEHNYNTLDREVRVDRNYLMGVWETIKDISKYNTEYKSIKNSVFCYDCGRIHVRNMRNSFKEGGKKKYICSFCVDWRYRHCSHCGNLERVEKIFTTRTRKPVCQSCLDKHYKQCNNCGNLENKEEIEQVQIGSAIEKQNVCKKCKRELVICSDCGLTYFQDTCRVVTDDDTGEHKHFCMSCYQANVPINEYNYKPNPKWNLDPKTEKLIRYDSLMFGVEWEIENEGRLKNETLAQKIKELMGKDFIYCKKDSTIHHGFEIVTHPFSWDSYLDSKDKWSEMEKIFEKQSVKHKSSDPVWKKTCGIHIHMTKRAFTTLHLYKFINFIYCSENRQFMSALSQREKESEYAKFDTVDGRLTKRCAKEKTTPSGDRRNAVNLLGRDTIEIRIFNSTVKVTDFYKNIEFLKSLYVFTKETEIKGVTLPNYLTFIFKKFPKTYKNLVSFIKNTEIMQPFNLEKSKIKKNKKEVI